MKIQSDTMALEVQQKVSLMLCAAFFGSLFGFLIWCRFAKPPRPPGPPPPLAPNSQSASDGKKSRSPRG